MRFHFPHIRLFDAQISQTPKNLAQNFTIPWNLSFKNSSSETTLIPTRNINLRICVSISTKHFLNVSQSPRSHESWFQSFSIALSLFCSEQLIFSTLRHSANVASKVFLIKSWAWHFSLNNLRVWLVWAGWAV